MSNYDIKTCATCGKPQSLYNKNLEHEHVLCIRDNRVLLFEELENEVDKKEELIKLLEVVKDKTKSNEIPTNIDAIISYLNRTPIQITDGEPAINEIGTCTLKTIIDKLSDYQGCKSGILPRECSYYQRIIPAGGDANAIHIYCMSKPPHIASINRSHAGGPKIYDLSVPFLHFIATIKQVGNSYGVDEAHTHYFASQKPLNSMDTPIIRLPLGNQGRSGTICWGQVKLPNSSNVSMHRYVELMFNILFQSTWSDDLSHDNPLPPPISSYDDWAKRTKIDPFFAVTANIKWYEFDSGINNFKQLIDRVVNNYETQ